MSDIQTFGEFLLDMMTDVMRMQRDGHEAEKHALELYRHAPAPVIDPQFRNKESKLL